MKKLCGGFLLLMASHAWADDPCKTMGIIGTYNPGSRTCDMPDHPFAVNPLTTRQSVADAEILARIVNNQIIEKNEISLLRADLKTAVDKLSVAVEALAKVSMVLVENNDKWQKATLNQTINAINSMPEKLATEKLLQTMLLASIKEQLMKDVEFLDSIKKSP